MRCRRARRYIEEQSDSLRIDIPHVPTGTFTTLFSADYFHTKYVYSSRDVWIPRDHYGLNTAFKQFKHPPFKYRVFHDQRK